MFKKKIKNVNNFTLTSDIWSETMRNKSFLGVTLHFFEENEIYTATLGVYELEERHTADYIAESWEKVCNEWGIKKEKISCVKAYYLFCTHTKSSGYKGH
jgi:hypothetical protein